MKGGRRVGDKDSSGMMSLFADEIIERAKRMVGRRNRLRIIVPVPVLQCRVREVGLGHAARLAHLDQGHIVCTVPVSG